ncbi:MAG: TRAP transporter large permease [Eubacteriales bacterium]|jgi:C4-dicarboxylate transporter DctM subunit
MVEMLPYILFGTFVVFLLLKVPVSFCLGISSLMCLAILNMPLNVVSQRMFVSLDSFSIMAIPLFILAGNIMTEGGMSRRLIGVAEAVLGNIKGGLAMAAILACAFFAALSGSGPATVVAIGGMLYPEMVRKGYPDYQMAGLVTVAGGLGPIIPPSIIMVVYATMTDTSITDLFTAGFVAGGLMLIALLVVAWWQGKRHDWPVANTKFSWGYFGKMLKESFWALLMPIIVLGGIYGGIFTATEAAAVAVAYSLIIGCFVYRTVKIRSLYSMLRDSAVASSVILFIMATSSVFSWLFTVSGISKMIVGGMQSAGLGYYAVLLIITVVLLIFGFFLEGIATVLLLIPLFWPVAQSVGIDPVHMGMIVTITNVVGCMTPPVAVNIFACSTYSKLPVEKIGKGEIPYLLTMVGILMLIVLVPQFTTFMN